MKTIVLAGHKGGLGKTTLSILLAQSAHQHGKSVALLDLDPQQSLYDWWSQRPDDDPLSVVEASHTELKKAQSSLEDKMDWLIIDTPPAHQDIIKAAVEAADIVIVPCSPSPFDIKGIGETITVLEKIGTPFFFVINRAINRTTIAMESLPLLAQHGKVAPKPITMRVDYAQGMIGGTTPLDVGNKRVTEETAELYSYIRSRPLERTLFLVRTSCDIWDLAKLDRERFARQHPKRWRLPVLIVVGFTVFATSACVLLSPGTMRYSDSIDESDW